MAIKEFEQTFEGSLTSTPDYSHTKDEELYLDSSMEELFSISNQINATEDFFTFTRDSQLHSGSISLTRQIIRKNSKKHYNYLIDKRTTLLKKDLEGKLLREEFLELKLIEWELDTIEDAFSGDFLDKLENFTDIQRELANELHEISHTDYWKK